MRRRGRAPRRGERRGRPEPAAEVVSAVSIAKAEPDQRNEAEHRLQRQRDSQQRGRPVLGPVASSGRPGRACRASARGRRAGAAGPPPRCRARCCRDFELPRTNGAAAIEAHRRERPEDRRPALDPRPAGRRVPADLEDERRGRGDEEAGERVAGRNACPRPRSGCREDGHDPAGEHDRGVEDEGQGLGIPGVAQARGVDEEGQSSPEQRRRAGALRTARRRSRPVRRGASPSNRQRDSCR